MSEIKLQTGTSEETARSGSQSDAKPKQAAGVVGHLRIWPAVLHLREPLIAVTAAAAFLAFLLWPGVLVTPGQKPGRSHEPQQQPGSPGKNDDAKSPPTAPGADDPTKPSGPTVSRTPRAAASPPPAIDAPTQRPQGEPKPQPAPRALSVAPPEQPAAPMATPPSAVAALLDSSVVLVTGTDATGNRGTGSGFFVAPELIVTNRHVIEKLIQIASRLPAKNWRRHYLPRWWHKHPRGRCSRSVILRCWPSINPARVF